MNNKRKVFLKTDLTIPVIEHIVIENQATISLHEGPPPVTVVRFPPEVTDRRTFDFAPWYGVGIDVIAYACQRQIERFLAKQDAEVTNQTIVAYCSMGLKPFLSFLVLLKSALGRELSLADITRSTIDAYIIALDSQGVSKLTKKNKYTAVKSVLKELCNRGLIAETHGGDNATFPPNPFPEAHRHAKGETPLPKAQRQALLNALRDAVRPLFSNEGEPTSYLLSCALLLIALYTGRNTTPLLEMTPDCLRPHPKQNTSLLALFKRRGYSTSKVVLRDTRTSDKEIEDIAPLRSTIADLVRRVIELSNRIRSKAPIHFEDRVWLYHMQSSGRGISEFNKVHALSEATLANSAKALVAQYDLRDSDGRPLRINVSRLRKTFANRVIEIVNGDMTSAAEATGNTVRVFGESYLRPGEEAKKNWKFMGIALTNELLTNSLGASEKTPVARCSDSTNGEYAPKNPNKLCMNFLDCLRCRNFVVTGDDLYRLFSFYWRLWSERNQMDPRRWKKQLAHIIRLIDRDVIDAGLANGIFTKRQVDHERQRAKAAPHPFWHSKTVIEDVKWL